MLDAVVGPKPAGSWRDRWPELQYAKFLRVDELLALHAPDAVIQLFRDNIHVIDAELAKIRESIDWKVESGWPRTLAEDYTLIMTHFKAALGDSVSEASQDFAAAVHLLRDALTLRAPLEAVAPDAYTDLDGTYGMKTNDSAWAALTPDAAPGAAAEYTAPPAPKAALAMGLRSTPKRTWPSSSVVFLAATFTNCCLTVPVR